MNAISNASIAFEVSSEFESVARGTRGIEAQTTDYTTNSYAFPVRLTRPAVGAGKWEPISKPFRSATLLSHSRREAAPLVSS